MVGVGVVRSYAASCPRTDDETSVTIQIDGDVGRIHPAGNILPPVHSDSDGGWCDIRSLSISRDFIRGAFKLTGLNRQKIAIDRRAGHIRREAADHVQRDVRSVGWGADVLA